MFVIVFVFAFSSVFVFVFWKGQVMSASGMLCPHLPHQRQLLDKEASQACHDQIQFRPIESKFTQEFGNALDSYHTHIQWGNSFFSLINIMVKLLW